jgi:hypothetical protein
MQFDDGYGKVGPMRRRPALAAGFAVVLLVAGQLTGLAHQAFTSHVTCHEHGEEVEAVVLAGRVDSCEHAHFIGVEGEGGDHEDCLIVRALHQSSATPGSTHLLLIATRSIELVDLPLRTVALAADLYRIAPKTSPPDLT